MATFAGVPWAEDGPLTSPERWLRAVLWAHAALSVLFALSYVVGAFTDDLDLRLVVNSTAKDALFVFLSVLAAAHVRRYGWLTLVIAAAYLVLIAAQAILLARGGNGTLGLLGATADGTAFLVAWMVADVLLTVLLVWLYHRAQVARYRLCYLTPYGFVTLVALAEVLVRGEDERVPADEVARNVDGYLSRIPGRGRGRDRIQLALLALTVLPLAFGRPPFPAMAPASRLAFVERRFVRDVAAREGGLLRLAWSAARSRRWSASPRRWPTSATTATRARTRRSATCRSRAGRGRRRSSPRSSPTARGSRAWIPARCAAAHRPTSWWSGPARRAASSPTGWRRPAAACSCSSAARTWTRASSSRTRSRCTCGSTTRARCRWRATSACRCCRACASAAAPWSTTRSASTRRQTVLDAWAAAGLDADAVRQATGEVRDWLRVAPVPGAVANPAGALFAEGARALDLGGRVHPLDVNIAGCLGCGYCNIGCAYGRKLSMLDVVLPDGQARFGDRLRVLADAPATGIEHDGAGRAVAVHAEVAGEPVRIAAATVVVAAGAVGSSGAAAGQRARRPAHGARPVLQRDVAADGGLRSDHGRPLQPADDPRLRARARRGRRLPDRDVVQPGGDAGAGDARLVRAPFRRTCCVTATWSAAACSWGRPCPAG